MFKRILYISVGLFLFLNSAGTIFAAQANVVTPVFPIRGREYWRHGKDINHLTTLIDLVEKNNSASTWLLHYDVLNDDQIIDNLQSIKSRHELGIFLEVTRSLAEDSLVVYDWSWGQWTAANKLFLSGYERIERQRIIDRAFEAFKDKFGYYPKSYGAWYVDVWSSLYIKEKYGAQIQLGLADQYATDGYQVWGQYINQPYYQSLTSAIEPAIPSDNSNILKVLWAPREPTLSYGNNVNYSNFSVQVNDYHETKGLKTDYFIRLIKTLTTNIQAPLAQAVIGLEVSEVPPLFLKELDRQLNYISKNISLQTQTLSEFDAVYRQTYPDISPSLLVSSTIDKRTSWWYFTPNYRIGIFSDDGKVAINDLRFYHRTTLKDNDQLFTDKYNNLHRVVPAQIDSLSLNNALGLGDIINPILKINRDSASLTFGGKSLIFHPDQIILKKFGSISTDKIPSDYLNQNGQEIIIKPQTKPASVNDNCSNDYGYYQPPLTCLKPFLANILPYIPDLRFSKLENNYYLGLRTGPTSFVGIRFPQLQIGKMEFPFPVLSHFLNLDKMRYPQWSWFGRQELEAQPYVNQGTLIPKDENYGQYEFLNSLQTNKIFENGYYLIYQQ